jgi:hypothetical protein
LNCTLEVTVFLDEDQLLYCSSIFGFQFGAKMNLPGSGRLKVVGDVVGQN